MGDNSEKPVGSEEQVEPKVLSANEVGATPWIKLQTLTYRDQTGASRKWDMATRTTKQPEAEADAVVILPLLRSKASSTFDTLLVEQFRPPVNRRTVEMPAGLIDKGETAEAAALRELKEETGYVGKVQRVSPEVCMSPGICDETVKLVLVLVDLDAPENLTPTQELEEGEFCVVKRVPLSGLREQLDASTRMSIEGLYLFALGLEIGYQQARL